MRASLITALALGCCLQASRALGDDFDDDFGTLPPPPAQPAAEQAPSQAEPDGWYGSYPPLDEDDEDMPRQVQASASRYAFVHPTLDGLVGGIHLVDADSARPGSFRVGLHGGYFRKDGFFARGDQHRQGSGALSLSVTPIEHLELAANVSYTSTDNRSSDPRVVQVVGDTQLFAKGYARVLPWLSVGGDVELALLNGVGSFGVGDGALNVGLRGNVSADLRALSRRIPLILRGNLQYLFDNSGKLVRDVERDRYASLDNPSPRANEYRALVTPAERYALGVNRVDRMTFGFGAELPLRAHERVWVDPLLEWTVAVPINRQGFDCLSTDIAGQRDGCLDRTGFATRLSNITFGVRVQPYLPGLSALLAIDVATSGARELVRELAPLSRYVLRFALSFAYDPEDKPKPRRIVQRIEIPAAKRGHIVGQVIDAETTQPLPNAIVHFEGTSLSDVVSDASGAFTSAELGPGAQGMRVRAEGYREALCVAVMTSQGNDVTARCELTPSAFYGALDGRITDNAGHPIANARITLRGTSEQMLGSGTDGMFNLPKLLEGEYEVAVSADGFFPRTTKLTVSRGSVTTPVLALIPRAEQPLVRITKKRVLLLAQVSFAVDSAIIAPTSETLLSELAEQLKRHPELEHLEVQGHGEDVPVSPGAPPLTQQRADAVRAWLVSAGIAEDRLTAKGYGPTRPLFPNITNANRTRNRRIELWLK